MNKQVILFNSIPRCGNTFLDFCFAEAIRVNLEKDTDDFYKTKEIVPHQHLSFLLRFGGDGDDITQFSIFRHPEQQIPSLFALPGFRGDWSSPGVKNKELLEDRIRDAIRMQYTWLYPQLENNKSNVILFLDLINNPNKVLHNIFNKIGLEFKKEIDVEKVKLDMQQYENDLYKDTNEKFNMGRLPRQFDKTEQYQRIKSIITDPNWESSFQFKEIVDLYNKVIQTKMGETLVPPTLIN